MPPIHDHVFNNDLLVNDKDLEYARSQFPEVVHILDYPRLREMFGEYEKDANEARDRVRRLGFTAGIFAPFSPFSVATKPLWPNLSLSRGGAPLVDLWGMFAALVAAGGSGV